VIYGTAASNVLNGWNNNDFLVGFSGNDTLNGGFGNDELVGGAGKDQLIGGPGGSGADTFTCTALSDSGITAGTRDLIADFEAGIDKIDLSLIDANTKTPGDDSFNFVGINIPTGFSGNPGELHAFWSAIGQIIEGDVNGDKKADFSIEIKDPTRAITLASTDFVL
jgi:Ca2+-binding RTX toxin-like protein